MEYNIISKIKANRKEYDYLINHSEWYKQLNRSSTNYKDFEKAFKENQRESRINKVNETVSTLDTVNSILKILK
jgi:putative IMPACT (imprinted ancient) family translation regulator